MTTPQTITKESLISLGLVASILGFIGWGAWNAASKLSAIEHNQQSTHERLTDIADAIKEIRRDNWTREQMAEFAAMLRTLNPSIVVPEIRK
jgi:hypothetical protein